MKRFLLGILLLAMILAMTGIACADDDGWDSDPSHFQLDGTTLVSYTGDAETEKIRVPYGVTKIGSEAFSKVQYNVQEIELPETVEIIDDKAFYYVTHITTITLPDGVTSIGAHAFDNSGLLAITIPGSVKSIGAYAFYRCSGLADVKIEEGVPYIGEYMFNYCYNLANIEIPNSVKTVKDHGLAGIYSLKELSLPGVEVIENSGILADDNLVKVSLPSVKTIGNLGIADNNKLESVVLSNQLVSIGENAFENDRELEALILPDSLKTIGQFAFLCNYSLVSVAIPEGVESIGMCAFNSCQNLQRVVIPESVESMGDAAFVNCSKLQYVTFKGDVASLGGSIFFGVTDAVFDVPEDSEIKSYLETNGFTEFGKEPDDTTNPLTLKGHSASLTDKVNLQFLYSVSEKKVNDNWYYAEMEYPDGRMEYGHFDADHTLTDAKGNKLYYLEFSLPAKYIGETVALQIYDFTGEKCGSIQRYSIADYCNELINDNTGAYASPLAKKVAKELLTYGYYTWEYFTDRDAQNSGSTKINPIDSKEISTLRNWKDALTLISENADFNATIYPGYADTYGLEIRGISLVLEDSIKERCYFSSESNNFSRTGCIFDTSTGLYYYEADIQSIANLGTVYDLGNYNWMMSFNPLFYLRTVLENNSNQKLTNLCIALYDYYDAVQNYIDSPRDLGGLKVTIGDWYTDEATWNVPKTAYDTAYFSMLNDAMEKHNFTLEKKKIGEWWDLVETVSLSITENRPLASVIMMDSSYVANGIHSGLFMDLATLPSGNWDDEKYNQAAIKAMSLGNSIYGFAIGVEPRTGIFMNLDIFEQCGVDSDTVFALQASGQWTFDEFYKLCAKLTKDTNNDGKTDIYGLTAQNTIIFQNLILANGTDIITRDSDNMLVMNAEDPKVLRALEFGKSLYDAGFIRDGEPDEDWDFFKSMFYNGKAAMYMEEEYAVESFKAFNLDHYAFISLPYGPDANGPVSVCRENIYVIPNCKATRAVADDIAFAVNIFASVPDGFEDSDENWKSIYYDSYYTDKNSLDTLDYIIDEYDRYMSNTYLISNFVPNWLYELGGGAEPSDVLERYSTEWQEQVNSTNQGPETAPDGLNGLKVVIGDWCTDEKTWNIPQNEYDKAYFSMLNDAMEEHNFTLERINIGEWGIEYCENVALSITENRPIASIIAMEADWAGKMIYDGLFMDVSQLHSVNWSDEKYNQAVIKAMSLGDSIYGFAAGVEPRTGIFLNLDVFEQCGVDSDAVFALQASGQWTYDAFFKLCGKLTKDTNNDGKTDIYGLTAQDSVLFQALILANGTDIISRNDNNKLVMNADDSKVLYALEFGRSLYDNGYIRSGITGEMWDYFRVMFLNGQAAMYVEEEYAISYINSSKLDNYAFISFPYGPDADGPISICRETVYMIPDCDATREVAEYIAFAYDIFASTPEGYEDSDERWKSSYYDSQFNDQNSFNTLNYIIDDYDRYMSNIYMIPDFAPNWLYELGNGGDPSDIIERFEGEWNRQVFDVNQNSGKPPRDLYGMEIVIGDWYTDEDTWDEAKNEYDEAYFSMLNDAMREHNFTLRRGSVSGWSGYLENVALSITENQPLASIFLMDSSLCGKGIYNGLFLDLSEITSVNWSDDKYNQAAIKAMSLGDSFYGVSLGTIPRTGIFMNLDIFEEFGVDSDAIFDLQAEGKWTFNEFYKLCQKLTKDTNNDGKTDIYGMVGQNIVIFQALLAANGTDIIARDADNKLVMNANDPKVLEALEFGHSLYEAGYTPDDKDYNEWDFYKTLFYDGKGAMWVEEEYAVTEILNAEMSNFAFISFPYGPSADGPVSICREEYYVIPNCDATRYMADEIAYALDIYARVPKGWESSDERWLSRSENRFPDANSRTTLDNLINKYDKYMSNTYLIYDLSKAWLYELGGGAEPSDVLERYSTEWQEHVDNFNSLLQ